MVSGRFFQAVFLLSLMLLLGGAAYALPPKHEYNRLLLATGSAIEEGRWDAATRFLEQIEKLEVDRSPLYDYFRGRVSVHRDQPGEARKYLERYIISAGEEGRHYEEALRLLTKLEEQDQAASARADSAPVAELEGAEGVKVSHLQALYLEDDPLRALLTHLNSLLQTHAWYQDRVLRRQPRNAVIFRLTMPQPAQLRWIETRYDEAGDARALTGQLRVYGVSPLVKWSCEERSACYIQDPRDGSRWIKIAHDPEVAEEIARLLGELIRRAQS